MPRDIAVAVADVGVGQVGIVDSMAVGVVAGAEQVVVVDSMAAGIVDGAEQVVVVGSMAAGIVDGVEQAVVVGSMAAELVASVLVGRQVEGSSDCIGAQEITGFVDDSLVPVNKCGCGECTCFLM